MFIRCLRAEAEALDDSASFVNKLLLTNAVNKLLLTNVVSSMLGWLYFSTVHCLVFFKTNQLGCPDIYVGRGTHGILVRLAWGDGGMGGWACADISNEKEKYFCI